MSKLLSEIAAIKKRYDDKIKHSDENIQTYRIAIRKAKRSLLNREGDDKEKSDLAELKKELAVHKSNRLIYVNAKCEVDSLVDFVY